MGVVLALRTFQSAIALLVGLFGKSAPASVLPLRLSWSPTTHFCRQRSCACPGIGAMRAAFETERHRWFSESRNESRLQTAVKNVAENIVFQPSLRDPLQLFDSLMGSYVCRRLQLPCFEGNCALNSHVEAMHDFHTWRMAQMTADRKGVLPRLAAAEALPILR